MKIMTKVNLIQKSLLLLGAALAMWGIFSPWKCYRGIVYMCLPGLDFDWAAFLALKMVWVMSLVLTIGAVYYAFTVGKIVREQWQIILSAIVIGVLVFFLLGTPIVINGGGLVFLLGTIATIWSVLSAHWQMAVRRIVPILLVIFSAFNLFEPIGSRLANEFPGEIELPGRVLLFLGSLLMFGASLSKRPQAQQDAA